MTKMDLSLLKYRYMPQTKQNFHRRLATQLGLDQPRHFALQDIPVLQMA